MGWVGWASHLISSFAPGESVSSPAFISSIILLAAAYYVRTSTTVCDTFIGFGSPNRGLWSSSSCADSHGQWYRERHFFIWSWKVAKHIATLALHLQHNRIIMTAIGMRKISIWVMCLDCEALKITANLPNSRASMQLYEPMTWGWNMHCYQK